MASTNSVTINDHIVQWSLEDATGVVAATSTLAWYSTAAPAVASAAEHGATNTFWMVKTITVIPAIAQASDTYIQLLEKEAAGPILFRAHFGNFGDVQSQTYDPPLRCRPLWLSTAQDSFTTGAKIIFQLA